MSFKRFLGLSLAALAAAAGFVVWRLNRPQPGSGKLFFVAPGMGAHSIGRELAKEGLIASSRDFQLAVALRRGLMKLKTGEYEFEAGLSPLQIADRMIAGRVKTYKITLAPGETVEQVVETLAASGLLSDQFELGAAIHKTEALTASYEGRLLPETYLFSKPATLDSALERMAEAGEQYWRADKKAALARRSISREEAIIMASIIEKETSVDAERPLVAAVIRNRLKLGMALQMDPTNLYGLKRAGLFTGVPGHRQIIIDTPYSTYHRPGLPPGPICNPGRASLDAALNPADSTVLYFVADGKGGHHFSRDYAEHLRWVEEMRRR